MVMQNKTEEKKMWFKFGISFAVFLKMLHGRDWPTTKLATESFIDKANNVAGNWRLYPGVPGGGM